MDKGAVFVIPNSLYSLIEGVASRGLHQGDPLLPFLLLLVGDVLNSMLDHIYLKGLF